MERRLAAVLAADVVGYGRLVQADEAGTLAALGHRRKAILEPLVAQHRGRIVKLMGDGVLVEFASAVNAVRCAVDLQRRMGEANAALPEERAIVLRVGVNLGEVVVDRGDLFGDGVNVAARLQAFAGPGEVYLSGKVHGEVQGKRDLGFEDQGEVALKNMAKPVRVHRVAGAAASPRGTAAPPRPRVAVLPFADPGDDPAQRHFSDGITEDITTELARFRQLSVLSPGSSSRFRDAAAARAAGRDLGAQHVVEGSVRRLGDRVRVTAQLVDAAAGDRLWAERFDRDQGEILAVQDQVVRTIAGTLAGRVQAAGAERARRKPPASLAAYECVLRGKALPIGDPEAEAEAEARRLYERAIELDPGYALAHAKLAHALSLEWFRDLRGSDAALDRALALAKRAVALDGNDPACRNLLGWVYLNRKSFDLAERHYERALELNPNDAEQVAHMGVLHAFLGRPDEAVEWFRQARLLDPYFEPSWYWPILGVVHFIAGRYEEAVTALGRSPSMPVWVQAYLAACHALAGRAECARELKAEALRAVPDFSLTRLAAKELFKRAADRDRLVEGLRRAGLPERWARAQAGSSRAAVVPRCPSRTTAR